MLQEAREGTYFRMKGQEVFWIDITRLVRRPESVFLKTTDICSAHEREGKREWEVYSPPRGHIAREVDYNTNFVGRCFWGLVLDRADSTREG